MGIGGLAQQAKEYSTNLYIIKTIVQKIRSQGKSIHFHIFGLCSPQYAKAFFETGVSFDGSTHARETFSSNTVLFNNGESLTRCPMHQAARCNCRTCAIARNHRINPKQINNRPASIMRLAHNLNSLLATYHYLSKPKTLYLVAGCGKQTNQKAAAKEVYCSQHFQACRKYAQTQGEWNILSPLHQVLEPEKIISPYDLSPHSLSPKERQ